MEDAIRRLPNKKAIGADGIAAEVIKAAGDVSAIQLVNMCDRTG